MYSKINFHTDIADFTTKYDFIKKLDMMFKTNDVGNKLLSDYLNSYLTHLSMIYNFTSITDTNYKIAEEYFNILQKLISLELPKKDLNKISEFIASYNKYKAVYNIEFIQSATKTIVQGDIFNILVQIVEKTNDGIEMLIKPDVLDKLQKVPIEDFYKMIMYLFHNKMQYLVLINVYATKIINYTNSTQYASMIKNYITQLYFDSGDEFYNWMSCCLTNCNMSTTFSLEDYNLILQKIKKFIKFYNLKETMNDII
jgi:hypothetical protein